MRGSFLPFWVAYGLAMIVLHPVSTVVATTSLFWSFATLFLRFWSTPARIFLLHVYIFTFHGWAPLSQFVTIKVQILFLISFHAVVVSNKWVVTSKLFHFLIKLLPFPLHSEFLMNHKWSGKLSTQPTERRNDNYSRCSPTGFINSLKSVLHVVTASVFIVSITVRLPVNHRLY